MNYVLFDDYSRNHLLPLTFTKPVADLRIGILTVREKWEKMLREQTSSLTEDYLSTKFPVKTSKNTILINGSVLPSRELVRKIKRLGENESLIKEEYIIAQHINTENLEGSLEQDSDKIKTLELKDKCLKLNYCWDIFTHNHEAIVNDFPLVTRGQKSQKPDSSNTVIGKGKLFIDKSAKVNGATLNTSTGPIFIGKDTEVMEGAMIRGPFALCEGGVVKMGAKIYGATTVGPHSKVGGELNNVVVTGYSNKAHDGFLGNSVIGEWCNIGADTNSSNLKNTYDEVKLWDYPGQTFIPTGLQFCGLIMGDHSKCAINSMFNTGTVVGVNSNIFGAGFQRNFIASFSWGGTSGFTHFDIDKALEVARLMYKRRNMEFTAYDESILRHIHKLTKINRRY
ncbi:MAG: glucose-1-phosphate thymidylyltransferase [Sphingobacteriia bacterium]|nr:glucose-1-phosphate thymidylyltransferase [Sphingobacteriia bacterium]